MKTKEQLIKERDSLRRELKVLLTDFTLAGRKEARKIEKKMEVLKTCILYLETAPPASVILEQLNKVERSIAIIDQRLKDHYKEIVKANPRIEEKKLPAWWRSQNDYPTLKKQAEVLRFLLN